MQETTGTIFATCRANLREGLTIRDQRRRAPSDEPYHGMIQQHSNTDGTNDLASSLRSNRRFDIQLQHKADIPLRNVGVEAIVMRSTGLQTLPDGRRLSSQRPSHAAGFLAELDHGEACGRRLVSCMRLTVRPIPANGAYKQAGGLPSMFALRRKCPVRSQTHKKVRTPWCVSHNHLTPTAMACGLPSNIATDHTSCASRCWGQGGTRSRDINATPFEP